MTLTHDERRPAGNPSGVLEKYPNAHSVSDLDAETERADRPRCLRCGHVLRVTRSLARAYGPRCWRATERGQLELRRDETGRTLAVLARRVGTLDAAALVVVADTLVDLLDALDQVIS